MRTDPATSARMRRVRTGGTACELAVRAALRAAGLRGLSANDRRLPGSPDVALRRERVAVFVHGCFWHGCPEHFRRPRRNGAWWAAKVARNRRRDRSKAAALRALGWSVVQAWEHEDPARVAARVVKAAAGRAPIPA